MGWPGLFRGWWFPSSKSLVERPLGPAGDCKGNGLTKGIGPPRKVPRRRECVTRLVGPRVAAGVPLISEPTPPCCFVSHLVSDALYPANASCRSHASSSCFYTSVLASFASQIFQKTLFFPSLIALGPYPSNTFLWLTLRFKHSPIKK